MNNDENHNDTYLADWLSGKISDEQLKQLVPAADFVAYKQLQSSVASLQLEDPDMEQNYSMIRAKIADRHNPGKPKIRLLYPAVAVAATIVLLFGLYQLLVFSNSTQTGIGEETSITLADNSVVRLNSKSVVSYPNLFEYNRTLKFTGEAFFEVQKGSAFCVQTPQGDVQVLGTKFNVIARPEFFEVVCYEGRVKVSAADKKYILSKGDAVRFHNAEPETWKEADTLEPTWLKGESSFRNLPFDFVIRQFENQYGYKVDFPKSLKQTRYSGSFPNTNLKEALLSVCLPLNLEYTITANQTIVLSE